MPGDGKQLEALVAFVENILLPQGFEVKTNERVYNDEGVQVAELDIEIRGKVGSTKITWLIECRDRPSEGPAPASWIEQLVGRRVRFGFNKVTAVSTTGFATGAIEFARSQGIELREVKALAPEAFENWLKMRFLVNSESSAVLHHAEMRVDQSETPERILAATQSLTDRPTDSPLLRPSTGGDLVPLSTAFLMAVNGVGTLFDDVAPNGPGKPIQLTVEYPDEGHFLIDTSLGPIRVRSIVFLGELKRKETLVPLAVTAEYRDMEVGQTISQVAAFAPQDILGMQLSMELHRIAETGETHIVLRRTDDKK